uniref:LAM_G_DOMAIN domain-containing protein n=1 Tax=Steinernema glaseri TaxID=37863 RepID=A0A1I7XYY9_9BILA
MTASATTTVQEFEVVPEQALRNEQVEFLLGMQLNQAITVLTNNARTMKNIELSYSKKEPLSRDITVTLKNDGVRLHFCAKKHRLRLIEVYDLRNIVLRFGTSVFSKPGTEANYTTVEGTFGATHPGTFDTKQKLFMLSWRGVAFWFATGQDSSTVPSTYSPGLGSLHFSNASMPPATRMTIFHGASPLTASEPSIPPQTFVGGSNLHHLEAIRQNNVITGLKFSFYAETPAAGRSENLFGIGKFEPIISFGDSQESVMSALGAPSKIYYKSDDRMLIQRSGQDRQGGENMSDNRPDFFFNYFSLGVNCYRTLYLLVPTSFSFSSVLEPLFTVLSHKTLN